MGKTTDEIRADIERTRGELDKDLDALADKVSPRQMVNRRMGQARSAVRNVREQVMGTASETAQGVGEAAQELPRTMKQKTRGNPLAAGALAFATGWLVSSLLPPTKAEEQVAETLREKANAPAQELGKEVRQAAQEVKESMREPVSRASSDVADTTRTSAQQVADEARRQSRG